VGTDVPIIRHISTLMKSPEIKITQVGDIGTKESPGEETVALSYDKIFPDSNPTKIQKENGEINLKLDHVDNSNKPFNRGIERQFITYLKNDIQIIKDDTTKIPAHDQNFWFSELISKKPGDISEDARQHGIEVPWQKVIVSTPSVITGIALVIAMVMAMIFIWYKIIKFHRVNEK
jgi:hypothetical protein